MLSMLRFCRAIKHRSVWYVDVVFRLEAENTSHSSEDVLISVGGKLAWPISAEAKKVTDTEKVKQKWRTLRFGCFLFCLPLFCKDQAKCDGSEEKQVILAFGARVRHTGHHFYLSERRNIEEAAFDLTWRKHLVQYQAGDGKHRVTCRCGTPAANPIAGCHKQGLRSLACQIFKTLFP